MGYVKNVPMTEEQISEQVKGEEERFKNATITAAINDETNKREQADAELKADIVQITTNITNEIATRATEDAAIRKELADSLTAEETARKAFDADIEASLASAVDNLTNALNTERAERITSDTAIVDQLTAKYDGKVTDLTAAINNEITQRQAQDNAVRTQAASSISAEATTRKNADDALSKKIDEVEAEIEHYEDFKPPTTEHDGEHGLVPAPPQLTGPDTKYLLTESGWEELKSTSIYVGSVPSQNGTPRYTGSVITPTWLNYEAEKLQISGETSATNAGEYTVNFTPIGLHCWSDGTRTARSVKWRIYPQIVTIPTASTTSYEYTGNNITVGISNPNSNGSNESGTKTAKNVGDYTVTYKLKSTTNYVWSDNSVTDKSIQWHITPKKIAKPTASKTSFDYNGNSQSLSISNYDSTYMTFSGSDTAVSAANYAATYTLKDSQNIHWSDNSVNSVVISWQINVLKLARPTAAKTEYDYTGNQITLDVANYNANHMTRGGTFQATAEGDYTVTYTLKNSSVIWSDGKSDVISIKWQIKSSTLAKPAISGDTSFVYTGSSIKPTITGYDSNKMSMTGSDTAVNVGTYTITYALKDKSNTKWESGDTKDVTLTWQVTRKPLTEAQSTFPERVESTYTGKPQTFAIDVAVEGYNPAYHDLSGAKIERINAGLVYNYIAPKPNYAWADGTYARKAIGWYMGKMKLEPPKAAKTAFEYDGAEKVLSISNYNSSYMTQEGTTSASAKGSYTVTYTLNDTDNFQWTNNTALYGYGGPRTITWSIGAKYITKPTRTDSQTFTYDGNAKTITVSGYDSSTMTFSGTLSETNAGDYQAVYSLKDKSNTAFEGGSTDDVVISWSIARATTKYNYGTSPTTVTLGEYDSAGKMSPVHTHEYPAEYFTRTGLQVVTNAGTYEMSVTPNSNYTWKDGSTATKYFTVIVPRRAVAKPYLEGETSFKYDGETHSISVRYVADSDIQNTRARQYFFNTSGNLSGSNVGSYTVTISHKNPDNTYWEDTGGTENLNLTWQITAGDGITKPTLTKNSVEWTGGNVSPTIANVDTSVMTKISGSDTATAIGTYTITYALKDKSNTKWDSGDTNDVVLTWYVTRKKLTAAQSSFSQSNAFTYDGTVKNITTNLSGYNSTYHDLSSTTTATNAGNYTVNVTPKSTYCWSDGNYGTKSVQWIVNPMRLTKPTLSNTTFTYDGNSHSPTINNFDSAYENKSGSDTAVEPNTYTLEFTLKNTTNTTWADSSTGTISLGWEIEKLTPIFTVDKSSFVLDDANRTATINFTYNGDGLVYWGTRRTSVAEEVAGNIASLTYEHHKNTEVHNWVLTAGPGTYYKGVSIDITVDATAITGKLADYTWAEIKEITSAGKAELAWDVGDLKKITLKGTVGTTTFDTNFDVRLVGFQTDWNASSQKPLAVFQFCWALIDKYYGQRTYGDGVTLTQNEQLNSYSYFTKKEIENDIYNPRMWEDSILQVRCSEVYNALSSDLQEAITLILPEFIYSYTTQNGNNAKLIRTIGRVINSSSAEDKAKYSIWIPSDIELFGYKELAESNVGTTIYQDQFEFFANGNTKKITALGAKTSLPSTGYVNYWLRNVYGGASWRSRNKEQVVFYNTDKDVDSSFEAKRYDNGTAVYGDMYSYGIVPFFSIG